ncbi:ATP-binding cassette domain-containing protein [Intrasporangium sp.]|uniref:ABC transporter ATP-binding protein n=1 Tax=Intrasporangium sp. TaxID=1925024 RepID=UPI003221FFD3
MLHIRHLSKRYGGTAAEANHDITLSFGPSQVVGLLGHNGAGKSTLLGQLVGAIRPTSGTVLFGTRDLVADPALARRVSSIMGQSAAPMRGVTPRDAVVSIARLRGRSRRAAVAVAEDLLGTLELGAWADTTGERLSGGVRRLTAYAMACAGAGPIILLDEPTNDVDPVRRPILWDHIRGLADKGHLVVVVTHNLAEAQPHLDRVVIMRAGRVVRDDPRPAPGSASTGEGALLRLTLLGVAGGLEIPFGATPPPPRRDGSLTVTFPASEGPRAIEWATGCQAGGLVADFSLTPATGPTSLEELYAELHAS